MNLLLSYAAGHIGEISQEVCTRVGRERGLAGGWAPVVWLQQMMEMCVPGSRTLLARLWDSLRPVASVLCFLSVDVSGGWAEKAAQRNTVAIARAPLHTSACHAQHSFACATALLQDFNLLTPDLVLSVLQCGSLSAREADILNLVCPGERAAALPSFVRPWDAGVGCREEAVLTRNHRPAVFFFGGGEARCSNTRGTASLNKQKRVAVASTSCYEQTRLFTGMRRPPSPSTSGSPTCHRSLGPWTRPC